MTTLQYIKTYIKSGYQLSIEARDMRKEHIYSRSKITNSMYNSL